MKDEEKILCETPTPGKQGTRIPTWKYDALRKAIIKAVPCRKEGLISKDLPLIVEAFLTRSDRERIGSMTWHVTTVKLHLEVCGELHRIEGARPQRIRRCKN